MKEKELRAGIRRMLLEQVSQTKPSAAAFKKSLESSVLGPGDTKVAGEISSQKSVHRDNNQEDVKQSAWYLYPEDTGSDPVESLKAAGATNVKNLGAGVHASKHETIELEVNGLKGYVIWAVNKQTKDLPPEKQPVPIDMLGIFAESSTVEGLGGADTIATATGGLKGGVYKSLLPEQQALTEAIYDACTDLASQAAGVIKEYSKGTAVNGNVAAGTGTAEVDVVIQDGDKTTGDVHVKFNDPHRLVGFQANDEAGKKVSVTTKKLLDPNYQPGGEAYALQPTAAQYKLARNAFLSKTITGTIDGKQVTATPYEIITSLRYDSPDASCPAGSPDECPEGEAPIDRLARMREPDPSKPGKDKSLELRMFDSGLMIAGKSMRQAYVDHLSEYQGDGKSVVDALKGDITKFFAATNVPVYFFNYTTVPKEVYTGRDSISVGLKVTRMTADNEKFTVEPILDSNTTNLFTVKYDGQEVFEIELRSRGSQNHPPQLKVSGNAPEISPLSETQDFGPIEIKKEQWMKKPVQDHYKRSAHPGLLESLSGLMVEAYAPGTKIGLIPMAAKPYHAGHHSLVQTAAAENDQVLLYISLSDRKRKGELTIRGEDMERIWKEEIEKILPGNVTPVYGGVPVRKVYEILGDAEEKLQMDIEPPVYTVYSDPTDTARNYSAAYRMKYFPTVASEGYVKFAGEETPEAFTRGEGTPDVSGTKMRASLQCGDEAAFAEGLPAGVDKEKIFNMLCPIQRMKSTVEEANFRMAVKRVHRKALLKEQSMYDTFVKPFTDVVAVAKLSAQKVLAASILNLRLWWDLDPEKQREAFQRYDKVKADIDSKLKPYMDVIDQRLAESDVSIIAAAVAPGFFFGQMGLEAAYNASKGTVDFLAGAGLDVPFLTTLFDGETPDRDVEPAKKQGLLGGLKDLFFGESAQFSDLPIILEQEEKEEEPTEKKEEKPDFKDAMETWLKDTGVQDKFNSYAGDLNEAAKKYVEEILDMVKPTAEITLALQGIDVKSDNLDLNKIKQIMAKAKEYKLPGAEDFEKKISDGAEKLADKPEFEEKADDIADATDDKGDGASDKEEQAAAEKIAIVEFITSFIESSKEGLPNLIKSAQEKIEEEQPKGVSLEALNTTTLGKEHIKIFTDALSALDSMAQEVKA